MHVLVWLKNIWNHTHKMMRLGKQTGVILKDLVYCGKEFVVEWDQIDVTELTHTVTGRAERGNEEVKALVAQSCPTLLRPPGSSLRGILQARMLEWVAIPFSRGSLQPWDWTWVSYIAGEFFTIWFTRETLYIHEFGQMSTCNPQLYNSIIEYTDTALKNPLGYACYFLFHSNPWEPLIFLFP